jgi:hypothetical protein
MTTIPQTKSIAKAMGLPFLMAAAAALTLPAGTARADEQAGAANSKDYTLFLGTDLAVKTKDGTYPVWDVSEGSWVLKVHGAPVAVGAKEGPAELKMKTGLRLTDASATIVNLRKEPEFTPANDPYTKFTKATNKAASDYAQAQFASNYSAAQMDHADAVTGTTSDPSQSMPGTSTPGTSPSASDAAGWVNNANMAAGASPGMLLTSGANPDTEAYDALDITFDVSAPRPLNRPYVVIICRYHERGAPAGAVRDWIHARPLNVIDSKPQHVHFLAGGFPPGYELRSFELHLYNMGGEIATNVSPQRVEYTMDEAFEYYRKQYVSSHRNATLPPVPAMGRPPADLPERLAQGLVAKTLYVRVSKDGTATGAFLDAACSRKAEDPYVGSLIRDIRFKPALENGEPVDGVATLMLDRLAL